MQQILEKHVSGLPLAGRPKVMRLRLVDAHGHPDVIECDGCDYRPIMRTVNTAPGGHFHCHVCGYDESDCGTPNFCPACGSVVVSDASAPVDGADGISPCAHCGSVNLELECERFDESSFMATLRCHGCGAQMVSPLADSAEDAAMQAIAAWNKRTDGQR